MIPINELVHYGGQVKVLRSSHAMYTFIKLLSFLYHDIPRELRLYKVELALSKAHFKSLSADISLVQLAF